MHKDFIANAVPLRSELAKTYAALTPLEQEIVQLFSIIYEPVSRTALMSCLNQLEIGDDRGKGFISKTLKPYLDKLLEASLLIQEPGKGPQCHPLLAEIATRDAERSGRFEIMAEVVDAELPLHRAWREGPRYFKSVEQFLREVRIGIYRRDLEFIDQQFQDYHQYGYNLGSITFEDIVQQVLNNPFDKDWFRTLPNELSEDALTILMVDATERLDPMDESFSLLEAIASGKGTAISTQLRFVLTEQLILRGRLREAQQALEEVAEGYRIATLIPCGVG